MKDTFYEIAVNTKYDGYQWRLADMMYKLFWQENRIASKCKWRARPKITQTCYWKTQKKKSIS